MRQRQSVSNLLGGAILVVTVTAASPQGLHALTCPNIPKDISVPQPLCVNETKDLTIEIEPAAGTEAVEVEVSIIKSNPSDPGDAVIVVDGTEYSEHTVEVPPNQPSTTIQIRGKQATHHTKPLELKVCTCADKPTPSCKTAEFHVGGKCAAEVESVGGCPNTTVPASIRISNKGDCDETFDWEMINDPFEEDANFSFSPASGTVTLAAGNVYEGTIAITIPADAATGTYGIILRGRVDDQAKCMVIATVAVGDADNPPADCGACTGSNSLDLTEVAFTGDCGTDCGKTRAPQPGTQAINPSACFEDCAIHFRVQAYRDVESDPCPANYIEVPGTALSAGNYCDLATAFDSQLSGHGNSCFTWGGDGKTYGNFDCVEAHEDGHVAVYQEHLDLYVDELEFQAGMAPVPVTGDPPTPTCTGALTTEKRNAIKTAVDWVFALGLVAAEADPNNEAKADAAEQQCDCYVADSILRWASEQPGIDVTQCGAWPANCD